MRDIEFRAWAESTEEFIDEEYNSDEYILTIEAGKVVLLEQHTGYSPAVAVIEQYTGLKDKNGNKIFEGDIVFTGVKNGVVVFIHGAWRIDCYNKHQLKESFSMLWQHGSGIKKIRDIEIIGNIHEEEA